jgi:hypothetical protein
MRRLNMFGVSYYPHGKPGGMIIAVVGGNTRDPGPICAQLLLE